LIPCETDAGSDATSSEITLFGIVRLFFAVVARVHEKMHERAHKYDQERQSVEDVSPVPVNEEGCS
jgi:hypothetical protein